MKIKKLFIGTILVSFLYAGCSTRQEFVNVNLSAPALKELGGSYNVKGLEWKLLVSCTGADMEPVVEEVKIDYSDTQTQYEVSMSVPMGKARHFSGMIYATGPDPLLHPRTYILAGDAGFIDVEQSNITVELNMLFLWQFGERNIFIDSRDRVFFSISQAYQEGVTQGGIGIFDGIQFFFVSLDPFLLRNGFDFSSESLYFTSIDGNDNTLWLGTSEGVFVFSVEAQDFVDFIDIDTTGRIPLQSPSDYVRSIMVKRHNQGAGEEVWFLMSVGIVIHNFVNGNISPIQDSIGNYYNFIAESPVDNIIYAGNSTGLATFKWDSARGSYIAGTQYLPNEEVHALYFEKDSGYKWVSSYSDMSEHLYHSVDLLNDLNQPGNFFPLIGSGGLDLNGINYQNFMFNIFDINAFNNLVYFGSDPGLIIFDNSANIWTLLEPINSYLLSGWDRGIRIDSRGNVWFTDGVFPVVLPAGVNSGNRETKHPDKNRVEASITIPVYGTSIPYGIAISADGQRIYAGVQNYSDSQGWIAEIDLKTNAVSPPIPLGSNASPYYVRLSPDGTKLYASDSPGGKLWVIDLGTKNVTQYLTNPPFGPSIFEISKDGTKGYFLNDTVSPYSIKVLDLVSNIGKQIDEIPIVDPNSGYVTDMVISSDETTAYVADRNGNKIFKADLVNKAASPIITFEPDPSGFTFSPKKLLLDEKNNRLIVGGMFNYYSTIVEVPLAQPLSYRMTTASLSSNAISDMLLSPDGGVLFVTYSSDYFHVFDGLNIDRIRAESPFTRQGVQGGPMVSSPDGKSVYAVTGTGSYATGWQLYLEIIK